MIKLLLISFLLLVGFQTNPVVDLNPTQNIIPLINNAAENTTFRFEPGTYYVGKLKVKTGQKFIGNGDNVVLSGSRRLTVWREEIISQKTYWTTNVTTNRNAIRESNLCLNATRCNWPEDLYVNDQFQIHVTSREAITTGTWFLERTDSTEKIWIVDNPTNKKIEISVEPRLFSTNANNIVLENLVIEKYASPLQMAALELKGTGYHVNKVLFRLNHAAGIEIWNKSVLENSEFAYNGQKGLGGSGTDLVVRWNKVHHNNQLSVDPNWDAGGSKFSNSTNLLIFQNEFYDNNGHGIWCDVRNVNCIIRNNVVYNENRNGIFCEFGVSCLIEDNTLTNNGWRSEDRLGDASITILDNNNSQILRNTIHVYSRGNAISVYEDERGQTFPVLFSLIRDNKIYFLEDRGTVGYDTNGNVNFVNNEYFVKSNRNYNYFYVNGVKTNFNNFKQDQGEEGTIDFIQEPTTLTPTATLSPTPTFEPTKLERKFVFEIKGEIIIREAE